MTVSSTQSIVVYEGNGATTIFDFDFLIPTQADAVITYTAADGTETVLSPSQYSISGLNDPNGGSVTFTWLGSPAANNTFLSIARVLPLVQDTDLVNQDGFYPQVVENALDYLTMLIQQINTTNTQAIRVPASEEPPNELPAAALRANQTLIFDSTGQPTVGSPSAAPISAAMQPVVAAATLPDARGLFGVGGAITATTMDEAPQLSSISTEYMVTGAVEFTLLPTSQLPNGWYIVIHALTDTVTVTPDAADTIYGYSMGASATVSAGTVATIKTDGAGNWWITTIIATEDFVGAIRATAGMFEPSAKYVYCDGASYLRATYPAAFDAMTMTVTVTKTSGTPVLGGFTAQQTQKFAAGMLVEGSGIPAGATILTTPSGGDTSITLDQNTTNSTTAPVTIIPFGAADTTHFNMPDLRGRVPAGAELATFAASRLTAIVDRLGRSGGAETKAILQANLPNVDFVVTDNRTWKTTNSIYSTGASGARGAGTEFSLTAIQQPVEPVGTAPLAASGGSGTALNITQPTLVVNYVIRVLP